MATISFELVDEAPSARFVTGFVVASLERLQDGEHMYARVPRARALGLLAMLSPRFSALVCAIWPESGDDTGDL